MLDAALAALLGLAALGCGQSSGTGVIEIAADLQEARCPTIASAVAAPAQVSQGGLIFTTVTATAANAADPLTYSWSPPANFAAPTLPNTSYTCARPGRQILTLTVTETSDGQPCSATATFPVVCLAIK